MTVCVREKMRVCESEREGMCVYVLWVFVWNTGIELLPVYGIFQQNE